MHDNYVGFNIKVIRAFFRYLNEEKHINTGPFYKKFHVRNEEVQIITLTPEQLNLLIYDRDFEKQLNYLQRTVKDIFVFGCTVALRYSDLMRIRNGNLHHVNGSIYLTVQSKKTDTLTRIKLPDYAIEIIKKYRAKTKFLFPSLYLNTFNSNIKRIGEMADWTQPMLKERGVRATAKLRTVKQVRFCELLSSHTMRRTAITNMLMLGMPETMVRKISGHAPGSKEFYRYVKLAQTFLDEKTDAYFEQLTARNRENSTSVRA